MVYRLPPSAWSLLASPTPAGCQPGVVAAVQGPPWKHRRPPRKAARLPRLLLFLFPRSTVSLQAARAAAVAAGGAAASAVWAYLRLAACRDASTETRRVSQQTHKACRCPVSQAGLEARACAAPPGTTGRHRPLCRRSVSMSDSRSARVRRRAFTARRRRHPPPHRHCDGHAALLSARAPASNSEVKHSRIGP